MFACGYSTGVYVVVTDDITILTGGDRVAPYVFIGDEAFPLKKWLMRPIPGRSLDTHAKKVYNYRLSRARRTIEVRLLNWLLQLEINYGKNNVHL